MDYIFEQNRNLKFVKDVENYPVLFNYKLPEYGVKSVTENIWKEIGLRNGLSASQCKDKWKNLKTVMGRHLRNQRSDELRRPYYLAEAMKFVIPFTKAKPQSAESDTGTRQKPDVVVKIENSLDDDIDGEYATISDVEGNGEECDFDNNKTEIQFQLIPTEQAHSSDLLSSALRSSNLNMASSPTQSRSRSNSPAPKKRKQSNDITTAEASGNASSMNRNNSVPKENLKQTSRKMFLLSLLPDIYILSDAQMRRFRLKLLNLVDEMVDENNGLGTST